MKRAIGGVFCGLLFVMGCEAATSSHVGGGGGDDGGGGDEGGGGGLTAIPAPTTKPTTSIDTCLGCREDGKCWPSSALHCGLDAVACEACVGGDCQLPECEQGRCTTYPAPNGTPCSTGSCVGGRCE